MATKKILGAILVSFAMAGAFGTTTLADTPKKDAPAAKETAKADAKKDAPAVKGDAKSEDTKALKKGGKVEEKAAPKADAKKDAKAPATK